MTFDKLSKIMIDELGTDKLSDIAMEFDVSPQVVSNWKSRNQVPYKYIKILRKKLEGAATVNFDNENMNPHSFDFFNTSAQAEEEDLLKTIMPYVKLCINNYIKIISITFIFCLSSYIYVKFIKIPIFESVAKIVPVRVSKQGSGISSLASSFGLNIGAGNYSSGITSAEMFPALIKSRSLMEPLLEKKFSTNKFGENKSLISMLLSSSKDREIWSYKQKKTAVDRLLRMIAVATERKSPLLTIYAYTEEPVFSAQLLESVIDQLVIKARVHKVESVKQTINFIKSRLSEVKIELSTKEDALKIFTESNRLINDSPALLLEQERMSRDLEVTSSLYGSLIREYEKIKIEESKLETYFDVLDPPVIPSRPSNINVKGTMIRSSAAGLLIALMFIFLIDLYRKKNKELFGYLK